MRGLMRFISRDSLIRRAPIPRVELSEPLDWRLGDPRQHVGEPSLRVDAIELGGLDLGVDCGSPLDAAARLHDQLRPLYANQGDWFGVARVDLVFAAAAFDEFTQSGNPYYLGAAAMFGVLGVLETAIAGVMHVVDAIFSWLGSLFGVEEDQPGSSTRPNNRDYTPEIDPGDELIADLQATRLRLPTTIGSQFGHYSPTAATVMQRFTMTGWDEWMMRYDPENYGRRIAGEVIP
jgi:hypothetical protein